MAKRRKGQEYINQWRIYDKSVRLVAVHGGTEEQIKEALTKAPDIIRGDLVILKPWEPEPIS